MAKEKFDKYTQFDIVGILDKNEENDPIIVVDGMEYRLDEILSEMFGSQIQIKCQID